jgi:hypothetical protein
MKEKLIYRMGLIAGVALIVSCFLPWTYHADVAKNFTGFFSEGGNYGKPGRFLIFFTAVILVFMILPKIWAKRTNLFLGAILVAYAIKNYILYTSCYMAYCPEKKPGIYIMLISAVIILVAVAFPNMKLPEGKQEQ